MTPRGVGGWGTQCPLSLPHPARAPPVRLPQAPPQSTGSVRGRGWLWPRRRRQGLPEPRPLPPARPPGRRPGHRGNAEEEGGARGLTGDMSHLSPGSADPRPPLPLGPAGLPAPHSPPRSGASSTSSSTSSLFSAVAPAPALRGDGGSGGSGLESSGGGGGGGGASRTRTHAARWPRPQFHPAPPSRRQLGFGPAFPTAFRSPLKGAARRRVVARAVKEGRCVS
ncbi:dual specificity protein phosphatase 8-like [Herpailurus yagouaroundi]|uniref:dual specificity protein phosphatase 8-like n=1 Tax=Herpailurus yagouaroundi TaxID=1608482 RepID=UPI001AD671A0|nr:dual specificity protein phosphatase 8-like [Puma yagouaroundi]